VFENKVLRRIFGLKEMKKEKGGRNEIMRSSINSITCQDHWMIKCREMK
jgi:hypothetical protein